MCYIQINRQNVLDSNQQTKCVRFKSTENVLDSNQQKRCVTFKSIEKMCYLIDTNQTQK